MASNPTYKEEREWGWFERFAINEPCTVKFMFVNKGKQLHLQTHENREEFLRIVSGTPEIIIGDNVWNAAPGDEFNVPVRTKHQVKAPRGDVCYLEIARGNFDENDIVHY